MMGLYSWTTSLWWLSQKYHTIWITRWVRWHQKVAPTSTTLSSFKKPWMQLSEIIHMRLTITTPWCNPTRILTLAKLKQTLPIITVKAMVTAQKGNFTAISETTLDAFRLPRVIPIIASRRWKNRKMEPWLDVIDTVSRARARSSTPSPI